MAAKTVAKMGAKCTKRAMTESNTVDALIGINVEAAYPTYNLVPLKSLYRPKYFKEIGFSYCVFLFLQYLVLCIFFSFTNLDELPSDNIAFCVFCFFSFCVCLSICLLCIHEVPSYESCVLFVVSTIIEIVNLVLAVDSTFACIDAHQKLQDEFVEYGEKSKNLDTLYVIKVVSIISIVVCAISTVLIVIVTVLSITSLSDYLNKIDKKSKRENSTIATISNDLPEHMALANVKLYNL